MKIALFVSLLLTLQTLSAQPAKLDDPKLTIAERYALMKSKAQTYGEYKAVKETDLDFVYKIMGDSLHVTKLELTISNKSIANLQTRGDSLRTSIQQKEASVQDIIYDSSHISVLGIGFTKVFFVGLIALLMAVMVVALVTVIARMKLMKLALREKSELAAETALEYTAYKLKAMEKQSKLARELQTELNRPGR